MSTGREIALDRQNWSIWIKFLALLGLALLAPWFHQPWLGGPMLDAILLIAVVLVGLRGALWLALLPSAVSLSLGWFPLVLLPLLPFMIIAHVIMVVAFDHFWRKNFWWAVLIGGLLKFLFLWSSSAWFTDSIIREEWTRATAGLMSWPQLATAFIGGVIAYGFLKSINKI